MLGKLFECEAERNKKYYRVIQTIKKYKDGKRFPIHKVVVADKNINLNATEPAEMGGFCISTYDYIFRWLIRGDTLCEVKIPENGKIYKTVSDNDVYVCEDKVNSKNIEIAIKEFEKFCKRREEEKYIKNPLETENVKILYNKLKKIEKDVKKSI